MYEADYMRGAAIGLYRGRKVAFHYAAGRFCPVCGSALRHMLHTDKRGRKRRIEHVARLREKRAPDAVKVDKIVKKGSYRGKKVGTEWEHVYAYLCPECGEMTEAQASLPPKAPPRPLPYDYYADGLMPDAAGKVD